MEVVVDLAPPAEAGTAVVEVVVINSRPVEAKGGDINKAARAEEIDVDDAGRA